MHERLKVNKNKRVVIEKNDEWNHEYDDRRLYAWKWKKVDADLRVSEMDFFTSREGLCLDLWLMIDEDSETEIYFNEFNDQDAFLDGLNPKIYARLEKNLEG